LNAAATSDRANRDNDQKKKETRLNDLIYSVAQHNSSFGELHPRLSLRRDVSCYHFITSTSAPQDTEVPKRVSFGHALEHVQVTDFHDIAEGQCQTVLNFLIAWPKNQKFPEEKTYAGYCSVSDSFCTNVARVN
jgi:hypothetical protein